MTLKKTHSIKKFEGAEVPALNNDLDRLYKTRLESRFMYEGSSSAVEASIYQAVEHGMLSLSATSTGTIVRSVALSQPYSKIIYASAHARSTVVSAHVTDVTNSSVQITLRSISAADVSAVTTAAVVVQYQVVGSDA